jgi:hypothetical protein
MLGDDIRQTGLSVGLVCLGIHTATAPPRAAAAPARALQQGGCGSH